MAPTPSFSNRVCNDLQLQPTKTVDIVPAMAKPVKFGTRIQSESALSTESTAPDTISSEDDTLRVHNGSPHSNSCVGDDGSLSNDGETKDEDEGDYFDDVHIPTPPSPLTLRSSRSGSILKRSASEELYVKEKRGSWKQLPKPDLQKIRSVSCPTTNEEKNSTVAREAKRVSFHKISVRSYAQTVGDNPSVSYGPPISLDWAFEEAGSLDLEEYEANRRPRRTLRQMMLNYYHRTSILTYRAGCTEAELKEAERNANQIKIQRALTRALLPCSKLEEVVQSAARKVRRLSSAKSPNSQ